MPVLSRFHGIAIRIFYEVERHQLPHFHAAYAEYVASFTIDPPTLLISIMPRKQQNLILEWAELHQQELLKNWERAVQKVPLKKIAGL